jgi:hypothetical protein
MRKASVLFVLSVIFSITAFAAPFVPVQLLLNPTSPENARVHFNINDANVNIPVEVQGNACKAVLMVYTDGMGESIGKLRNGYIGWHYINKVDTCIYVSAAQELQPGDRTLVWNFMNKDDVKVSNPDSTFNYYIFAYEHQTPKVPVMGDNSVLSLGTNVGVYVRANIEVMGNGGEPRTQPVIQWTTRRWVIGGDPTDPSNFLTTSRSVSQAVAIDKNDDGYYYSAAGTGSSGTPAYALRISKWSWVAGGESLQDMTWNNNTGQSDNMIGYYGNAGSADLECNIKADKDYIYFCIGQRNATAQEFWALDYTGAPAAVHQLGEWYVYDGTPPTGSVKCGGPRQLVLYDMFSSTKGLLNHHGFCFRGCVDPVRGLEDPAGFQRWGNTNGDYFTDHNMDADPSDSLYQICNDTNKPPYCYCLTAFDGSGLTIIHTNTGTAGVETFGLMGPDGTAAGLHQLFSDVANTKYATRVVGYGSAYDGLYVDNNSIAVTGMSGAWYSPANDFAGKLLKHGYGIPEGVNEEGPAGFSVAQNTPNPFNPTTEINFTIPSKGLVTIDIVNVAGQKVHTIRKENLDAGSHKVTWNAASMPGGVYFYTVTSGKFSRTMKMMLVK